jgi:peptide/nickel transport system permease protein
MTTATIESALPTRSSPWASRLAVTAVHFFVMVLFLVNMRENAWAAILGFLLIHVYSVLVLRYWSNMERSTAGDTAIVALTLEYLLIAVLFWDSFSAWPWSTFFGLVLIQLCAFSAVRFWKGLSKAPLSAWFGLVVILLYVIIAATAPIIAPHGETAIVGAEFEPWGDQFLLGTDHLGRDTFTRLIYGARNTIGVAFLTTLLAFTIGALGGFLGAVVGGWVDQVLGRVVDVMMAIPSLIFALLILTIVGTSIPALILVIGILDSTRVFRLARAVAMNIVVMDYVEVARLRGEGLWWVIRREVLPNAMAPLVAEFGLRFCFVFLFLSALSFLGLGIQPPTADWGSMVRENATLINYGDVTPLLPAAAIALLTVGVNFVVDWFLNLTAGLRDDQ